MLRGLPEPAPRSRVAATYLTAIIVGLVASLVVLVFQPLLGGADAAAAADRAGRGRRRPLAGGRAVAGAADGDGATSAASGACGWSRSCSAPPVAISMFLVVQSVGRFDHRTLLALALAAPVAWPFSALFIRALYGDLTGRTVVAPQDRTD